MKNRKSFLLYILSALAGVSVSLIFFLLMWFFTSKDMLEIVIADVMFAFPVGMYFMSVIKDMEDELRWTIMMKEIR